MSRALAVLLLWLWAFPALAQFNGTNGIFALNHMTFGVMSTGISVISGGTGYTISDTITLDCQDVSTALTTKPVVTVTAVSAGAITAVSLTTVGYSTALPSTGLSGGPNGICDFTQLSTSGSGSGAIIFAAFGFNSAATTSVSTGNLIVNGTITQTLSLTGTPSSPQPNTFEINSDNAAGGSGFITGWLFQHVFGGSSMTGGREPFIIYAYLVAPSSPSNTNHNYPAFTSVITAKSGDNGTSGTPEGQFFAIGAEATACGTPPDNVGLCNSNPAAATFVSELTGGEINVAAHAGSSVNYKSLWTLVGRNDDAVHGTTYDIMLSLSTQAGAVTWNNGIEFIDANGQFPISTTGTFISAGAVSTPTVAAGINFANVIFTGNAFASPGFKVNSTGEVTALDLLTQSSGVTTTKIGGDVNGAVVIGPTTGGSGSAAPYIAFRTGTSTNDAFLQAVLATTLRLSVGGTTLFDFTSANSVPYTNIVPAADSTLSMGTSPRRWASVYGTTFFGGAGVSGVTCSGTPSSSFASAGGIVTHC